MSFGNSKFQVSVIIPVYNAEKFLVQSVASAVTQTQTGEVLLVEDRSPDNSLQVCKLLAERYQGKVRLITHTQSESLGAGGARNLGIQHARYPYISFLDADDYYLPNRFEIDEELFRNDDSVDGVYGYTMGVFENEFVKQKYLSRHSADDTVTELIPPEDLLYALLFGGKGRFHTNAITLKKEAFQIAGLFDVELRLAQDTECWARLAAKCKLVAGNIHAPVAVRIVHEHNRIHNDDVLLTKYGDLVYKKLFYWAIAQTEFSFAKVNYFFTAFYQFVDKHQHSSFYVLLQLAFLKPRLFFNIFFYRKLFQILRGL
jgi:glycosyltransferase involved in cell wall biosynthesis